MSSARSEPEPEPEAEAEARDFRNTGSLGAVFGYQTSLSNDSADTGNVVSVELSHCLLSGVHLVESMSATLTRGDAEHGRYLLGIRWTPLASRRMRLSARWRPYPFFDAAAVYTGIGVGLDARYSDVNGDASTQFGPAMVGVVGWLPAQGEDYAFGLRLAFESAYHAGFANSVSVSVEIRLNR